MKRLLLVAAAYLSLLACAETKPPAPQGTVYFRMNDVTCKYAGSKQVTFYIGGQEAGSEAMVSGSTSSAYVTKASEGYRFPERNPIVQARIANYTPGGGALWTVRSTIGVNANEEMTHSFDC